jgi:stage III sporulation protein AB
MIHIKDQIKHFNKPLCDIYTTFESENSAINTFLHNLCITDWDNALENTENLQISSKCRSILREFGKKLGKNDYTSQMEMCDYYINIFEKEVELLCSQSPQKTKLSISLAFYAGLLLLIIMW